MNLSEKVGLKIRKFRLEKGLSQEELAHVSGLQQSQIYRIENGKRRFNSDQLEKISQALGIPVIKFFEEDVEISAELNNQRLLDILSKMKKERRKELIEFLQSLDKNVDIKILENAVKLIRSIKKS